MDCPCVIDAIACLCALSLSLLLSQYIEGLQQSLILKDVFVKYEDVKLERQVGEGSFGIVYKATFRGAQVGRRVCMCMCVCVYVCAAEVV